ncbi:hypothetical protein SprV_1002879200 [Sparganum proliferum]
MEDLRCIYHTLLLPHLDPASRESPENRKWERAQADCTVELAPWRSTPHPLIQTENKWAFDKKQHQQELRIQASAAEAAPRRANIPGSDPTHWECHRGHIKEAPLEPNSKATGQPLHTQAPGPEVKRESREPEVGEGAGRLYGRARTLAFHSTPFVHTANNRAFDQQQHQQEIRIEAGVAEAAPRRAASPGSVLTHWECHRGNIKEAPLEPDSKATSQPLHTQAHKHIRPTARSMFSLQLATF